MDTNKMAKIFLQLLKIVNLIKTELLFFKAGKEKRIYQGL